jgi:putative NAD(P)-binding protein
MAACGRLDPQRSSLNSSRKPNKGRQANDPTAHPFDWRHRHGGNRNDPALVKAGHRVRALVRDRAKATKLGPKVELVVGDLDNPASLKPAFASVDEAFVVVNGKDLNRLEANAFDAAKSAGVSHIVKLSGRGVDWPSMHDTILVLWPIPRPGLFASKLRSTIGCAAPTCGECRRPNSGCRRIISSKIATEKPAAWARPRL